MEGLDRITGSKKVYMKQNYATITLFSFEKKKCFSIVLFWLHHGNIMLMLLFFNESSEGSALFKLMSRQVKRTSPCIGGADCTYRITKKQVVNYRAIGRAIYDGETS
jgi:hypothetical protein